MWQTMAMLKADRQTYPSYKKSVSRALSNIQDQAFYENTEIFVPNALS